MYHRYQYIFIEYHSFGNRTPYPISCDRNALLQSRSRDETGRSYQCPTNFGRSDEAGTGLVRNAQENSRTRERSSGFRRKPSSHTDDQRRYRSLCRRCGQHRGNRSGHDARCQSPDGPFGFGRFYRFGCLSGYHGGIIHRIW